MRRRVVTILLLLLAGAVVNVGVAWACALVHGSIDLTAHSLFRHPRGEPVVICVVQSVGSEVVWAHGRSGTVLSMRHVEPYPGRWGWWDERSMTFEPRWSVAYGLPFLTLMSWKETVWPDNNRGQTRLREGYSWRKQPWRNEFVHPVLALRPLWPGFAVNTLFYAMLLLAAFVLRRHLRVRRGLCPACAYPVGEAAVCSECGGAGTSRVADGSR